jgi:hypothetical protein
VRRIDEIFAIEREISGIAAAQRLAVRDERIRPLVGEFERWMRAERARLSHHADIAKGYGENCPKTRRGSVRLNQAPDRGGISFPACDAAQRS